MIPAPIAIFAFNRSQQLQTILEALASNSQAIESDVTIFCDGPRTVQEQLLTDAVRSTARAAIGFKSVTIVERTHNFGCAQSIICGLQEMFAAHDKLIVFEDDILASPHTLEFLNNCLAKYQKEPTVFSIAAWSPPSIKQHLTDYPYDAFFSPRFNCWGWAMWRDRFEKIDWKVSDYQLFAQTSALHRAFNQGGPDLSLMLADQLSGKLDTWDIVVDYSRFKHAGIQLSPVRSYTCNIGMGSGTHCTEFTTKYDSNIRCALPTPKLPEHIFCDEKIVRAYKNFYAPPFLPIRAINKLWRIFFDKNLVDR